MLQGDRTEKIAIIDQEYVIHQGIQTLGGAEPSVEKVLSVTLPLSKLFISLLSP